MHAVPVPVYPVQDRCYVVHGFPSQFDLSLSSGYSFQHPVFPVVIIQVLEFFRGHPIGNRPHGVLIGLRCFRKSQISYRSQSFTRASYSSICFVLFMFIYGTILWAYLVRNPDRNIFLRSNMARFLVRFIFLRFILWSILDRNKSPIIALRSNMGRFLVRKWNDVIDGGLPAGPEIKGDPAGLTQFFPCPLD